MVERQLEILAVHFLRERYKKDPLDIHNLNKFIDELLSDVPIGLNEEPKIEINTPIKDKCDINITFQPKIEETNNQIKQLSDALYYRKKIFCVGTKKI